jgi:hypothetical protein
MSLAEILMQQRAPVQDRSVSQVMSGRVERLFVSIAPEGSESDRWLVSVFPASSRSPTGEFQPWVDWPALEGVGSFPRAREGRPHPGRHLQPLGKHRSTPAARIPNALDWVVRVVLQEPNRCRRQGFTDGRLSHVGSIATSVETLARGVHAYRNFVPVDTDEDGSH